MANWQADFTLKSNLVQRDIEFYEIELRKHEKDAVKVDTILDRVFQVVRAIGMTVNANVEAAQQLKAAIKAGWVLAPSCRVETVLNEMTKTGETRYFMDGVQVEDLHAGKVRWYGAKINKAYNEAVAIPDPNS